MITRAVALPVTDDAAHVEFLALLLERLIKADIVLASLDILLGLVGLGVVDGDAVGQLDFAEISKLLEELRLRVEIRIETRGDAG